MAKKEKNRGLVAVEPGFSLIDENLLKSRIYTIRGVKVMLDADLAEIYGYSTKVFNQQVKNNIEKFDEDFRFQLTNNEIEELSRCKICTLELENSLKKSIFAEKVNLRCKNCTSSDCGKLVSQKNLRSKNLTSSWGGARYAPFAFTEQGIYMLMTVLKGEQATAQSKALIRLFKQMKDYIIAENQSLLGTSGIVQIATQTVQNTQDIARLSVEMQENRDTLQKVMENFVDPSTHKHFLILNGQRLELAMNKTRDKFHDRYIFLDYGHKNEKLFHCGASSKDAGNKITTIMQIEYTQAYRSIMALLEKKCKICKNNL